MYWWSNSCQPRLVFRTPKEEDIFGYSFFDFIAQGIIVSEQAAKLAACTMNVDVGPDILTPRAGVYITLVFTWLIVRPDLVQEAVTRKICNQVSIVSIKKFPDQHFRYKVELGPAMDFVLRLMISL